MKNTGIRDPAEVSVQVQFRCPFWYREQLYRAAEAKGMNLSNYVASLVEAGLPPIRL